LIVELEAAMVRIKVEYDKYNRTFKLLDREFGPVLEDAKEYELILAMPSGLEEVPENSGMEAAAVLVGL
jgi:hypothetical protein